MLPLSFQTRIKDLINLKFVRMNQHKNGLCAHIVDTGYLVAFFVTFLLSNLIKISIVAQLKLGSNRTAFEFASAANGIGMREKTKRAIVQCCFKCQACFFPHSYNARLIARKLKITILIARYFASLSLRCCAELCRVCVFSPRCRRDKSKIWRSGSELLRGSLIYITF
jgi:hypothetical protein